MDHKEMCVMIKNDSLVQQWYKESEKWSSLLSSSSLLSESVENRSKLLSVCFPIKKRGPMAPLVEKMWLGSKLTMDQWTTDQKRSAPKHTWSEFNHYSKVIEKRWNAVKAIFSQLSIFEMHHVLLSLYDWSLPKALMDAQKLALDTVKDNMFNVSLVRMIF